MSDAKSTDLRLPIHRAAIAGDLAGLQKELDKGVEIDAKDPSDQNCTALHHAAWNQLLDDNQRLGVVKFLVENKANVNQADDTGWTVLHSACCPSHSHMVEFLIDMRADVNKADDYGTTPLMSTMTFGFRTHVQVLLANKADVTAKAKSGRFKDQTALDIAKSKNLEDIVDMLSVRPPPLAPPAPRPSRDTPLTPPPTALPTA